MRVGIDLDNTIVCYDGLIHAAALEQGLVPADLAPTKSAVRDYLRATGREPLWTALQGYVYGPGMERAEPFPGVLDFVAHAGARGAEVVIVSHRSRTPYAGPAHDLHASARGWLGRHLGDALSIERQVHLAETKADKIARIRQLSCDWFIDDLPEFLGETDFPRTVRAVLFDPTGAVPVPRPDVTRAASWAALQTLLFP
jgi:hypothetical protein